MDMDVLIILADLANIAADGPLIRVEMPGDYATECDAPRSYLNQPRMYSLSTFFRLMIALLFLST